VQQGGIRGKADSHTTAKREMPKAKQVLRKCLSDRPQFEKKMWISLFILAEFYLDNRFDEKICGQIEPP
jgi:hypothetical protein